MKELCHNEAPQGKRKSTSPGFWSEGKEGKGFKERQQLFEIKDVFFICLR